LTSFDTGRVYAGKVIPKASLQSNSARKKLQNEIRIHRSVKHPNVVRFERYFEDPENIVILLELCTQQTLMELVKRRKNLTETEAQCYLFQLVNVVHSLHQSSIIHRDLKLGNLFLSQNMEIKVGDFGLATRVDHPEERKKTICGTPNYIAPEVIADRNAGHSFEVDTWAIGVIAFTLLFGRPPFETASVKTTYERIRNNVYTFPDSVYVTPAAKDFISSILHPDPAKRPSLTDLRMHPFFTQSPFPACLPAATADAPLAYAHRLHPGGALYEFARTQGFPRHFVMTRDAVSAVAAEVLPFEPAVVEPLGEASSPAPAIDTGAAAAAAATPAPAAANSNPHLLAVPTANAYSQPQPQPQSYSKENAAPAALLRPQSAAPKSSASAAASAAAAAAAAAPAARPQPFAAVPASVTNVPAAAPAPAGGKMVYPSADLHANGATAAKAFSTAAGPQPGACPIEAMTQAMSALTVNGNGNAANSANVNNAALLGSPAGSNSSGSGYASSALGSPAHSAAGSVASSGALSAAHSGAGSGAASGSGSSGFVTAAASPAAVSEAGAEPAPAVVASGVCAPGAEPVAPSLWVNLWVDYSNKYGLGYLLSDGSCGVHFNDYTKIVLHPNGADVQYITKKAAPGQSGFDVQNFRLNDYPADLQKKVTLLHHFMKYLVQQNKSSAPQPGAPDYLDYCSPFDAAVVMPHVRSWCRTEHAMVFRLSSRVSQFIFFDETELVLSTDTCVVAYTDKLKERKAYAFADVFAVPRPDLHKRMKYARQIMTAPPAAGSNADAAPAAAPAPAAAAPAPVQAQQQQQSTQAADYQGVRTRARARE